MEETRKSGRGQRTVAASTESKTATRKSKTGAVAAGASLTKASAKRTTKREPSVQPDGLIREEWIRVAAYYRAERRGFAPGHDLEDWFAAEAGLGARKASARVPRGRKTDVRADR